MIRRALLGMSVLLTASLVPSRPAVAAGPVVEPKAAFERLKSLAGAWQGQAGHGQMDQPATVVYRVASGGSVVQETLFPGSPHEATSRT